jgi:hypothetical protein
MNGIEEKISEEVLIEIFEKRHPDWSGQLRTLNVHFASKGSPGGLAPIKGDACGVCRMRVASVLLQKTKDGSFISCASCARFLYLASKVMTEQGPGPAVAS